MTTELKHLANRVARSFDRTIEMGNEGYNQYCNLPEFITNNEYFSRYLEKEYGHEADSGSSEIVRFFRPHFHTNFLDLGCCLNLIDKGYADWKSTYYGVDISPCVIEKLHCYLNTTNFQIGGLFCCNMFDLPFKELTFDFCACIGSLEYYPSCYAQLLIREVARVLKDQGKFVVDIPNIKAPEYELSKRIEQFLGRPDLFDMSQESFESIILNYFTIVKTIHSGMIKYFLLKKPCVSLEMQEPHLLGVP